MELTKGHFEEIMKGLATKGDLKGLATKGDLSHLATQEAVNVISERLSAFEPAHFLT